MATPGCGAPLAWLMAVSRTFTAVIGTPDVLVTVRLMVKVPGAPAVYDRLGAIALVVPESSKADCSDPFCWNEFTRPVGDADPSTDCWPPTNPPVVETNWKSAALLPTLVGRPAVTFRTHAHCSAGLPATATSPLPRCGPPVGPAASVWVVPVSGAATATPPVPNDVATRLDVAIAPSENVLPVTKYDRYWPSVPAFAGRVVLDPVPGVRTNPASGTVGPVL